ncbi:hypothetical protein [Micromonospora sp. NPDC005652]|uniref:hypothetical protein n=1 Tax=Micromonospora sp. NPDC005652 TaxID=3157046 RepID=UPI00340708B7
MPATIYVDALTTPRKLRTDISARDIADARLVLRHALERSNNNAGAMHTGGETQWQGDTLTVAVTDPEGVFADPECQDLARKIARRPRAGVRLLFLFTAADFVAKKNDEQAPPRCAPDCPPPLRATACGCPTLRAAVLLGAISAEVDGKAVTFRGAAC